MTEEDLANLTVRISADTMRRLRVEAAQSGQSIRDLVQLAVADLLDVRTDQRRAGSAYGRCGE